jgi:hypothetical protein
MQGGGGFAGGRGGYGGGYGMAGGMGGGMPQQGGARQIYVSNVSIYMRNT